ncbi:hypothetical protein [Hymenobacter sp. YC55]|uniref:hypothetical protein n=1 Tax=Hymenobacter sp. YC55 TaxID=3034019 RepID=UPI0023F97B48|nr:hypothetical protein [Hymenobacter sp. YC55]MDF7810722.1 hypothetical protein [Hymenobacter sp. YC55]
MNIEALQAAKTAFVATMQWNNESTEHEKNLVLGNLNGFISYLESQNPTTDIIKIRTYQFQYGILHLKESDAKTLSLTEVTDKFGHGKGPLLDAWDDVMDVREFNALESFTEQ